MISRLAYAQVAMNKWEAASIGAKYVEILLAKDVSFGRGSSKIKVGPIFARSAIKSTSVP
jgi:hypothetical protein